MTSRKPRSGAKTHHDRCCGAGVSKCFHTYELVRTNKNTGEKKRIRLDHQVLAILDVTKDEWR